MENKSTDNSPTLSRKSPKKLGLTLDVKKQNFEENHIVISQNSTSSYVVEHVQLSGGQTNSTTTSIQTPQKIFFNKHCQPKLNRTFSSLGQSYYVTQQSHSKEMQDTYKVNMDLGGANIQFFAVYDGHSTRIVAEMLAQKLDEYIFEKFDAGVDMIVAIKEGFAKAEEEIVAFLKETKIRGGSTALCTIIHKGMLYIANLGDSRVVLFQKDSYQYLSNLHNFKNEAELQFAESKGGVILKDRLDGEIAVSRSFGDLKFQAHMNKEPEIIVHQLQEQDEFLLIATDGLWDGLTPEAALEIIKQKQKKEHDESPGNEYLEVIGDSLMETSCQNIQTRKDNMTLVLVDLKYFGEPVENEKISS